MMADDLEKFIEDQKAKLAQDKAELENDPPYMEMRNKESEKLSETSKMLISMAKENIPPNSQQNYPLGDYGLSLPLGEEYERKKHKLKEELRQDYRRYLSQGISQAKRKKNYLTTDEVDPYTQGLSLPIDERRSAKERLRLERNKEYNQYLRDKEEWNERLRRLGKKNRENEMHRNKTPIAVTRLQPELHAEVQPCNPGAEPPKKDAFTSTERCEELLNKRWMEEDRYHRLDDEVELRSQLLNKRFDEDLDVPNQRHHGFTSQSVIPTRKHHRIDEDGDFGRRYYRVDYDPETNAEMDPRFRSESTYGRKTPRVFYAERPYLNGMVRDVPADYEDELKERARVRPLSRTGDSRNQIQISSSTSEQVKSAGERRYATGLVLGGQDRELLQRRKEKYRQELMEQMAEQQRNKRREKELELSVAASGVQDPEKQPDRLKQFGFTARAFEEKVPPERPRVAFQTPMPARSASPVNEDSQSDKDFQRGLVSSLGEMLAPRLAPLPPPPPPVLTDNYKTPYDDAYYFYGARNPLDPALAYYGTGMMGMQPTSSLDPPLGQAPVEQPVSNIGERNTGDRQRSIGMYSEEKTKPSKEATLSYQQELQQQIREREERRRQEREEKEKLEAEMKNYNPWGKGGGGAPLKDAEGNLITDLNVMHKRNEEAYHNPEPRPNEDKRAIVDLNLASSRPENSEASTNKIAGITFAQASPFARGNVFAEPPSPEQLKRQESYKNFLRLQIEEKRRREEAEREKLRIEEEKEEKRLAEQRMRIQKAYEEELEERRRKDEERRLKNKEVIQLGEERRKEAEKRQKEKEEKQEEQLRQYFEKEKMEEEKKTLSRQSSPVIPALQNKSARKEERIPSAESRLSYYAQDPPQPRAPSPPVPARRNQLRSLEERKNVINELSEMRKQLRSEERRLQEQLLNVASHDNVPITRRRREKNPRDIFEMARLRLQAPVRRPSLKEAQDPVNIQNIWEFNELKYKDPETRMVLRHMYPDPPKDDQTLEIQQQALLREQQRKLDKMRMRRETEVFDDQEDSALDNYPQTMGLFRNKSNEFQKNSLLESDSAFIGANGEMFSALEEVNLLPQHPLSARERRRLKQRALESAVHEEVPAGQTPLPQPDSFSLHSNFSLDVEQVKGKNEERLHRLTELQQNSPSLGDDISLGDVDDLLKRAQSQASSTDTVATEPWLRPGTSATLRRLLAEQPGAGQLSPGSAGQLSPGSAGKLSQQSALPMAWHGLSTAHG
ncbi:centrosome and spindle pole-associated protein 1 isoform X1 [Camarhynchus parvulus]|uniref:centrosome and spindle pole-associated protein 1 isoform X1 n=1 Tax=Geospiza parvula TaxID=87175 RepID=UPI001237F90F|nr:centrosome and spindle pole-associated protein 1 isoform X1 [Camarhynchus parvulus]XP_030822283.1 centrosome and spindle pole-associated protein 1 isoform X1 [Camarhynchus parvulus]